MPAVYIDATEVEDAFRASPQLLADYLTWPRANRRAVNRDVARARPVAPKRPQYGAVARWLNARRPMPRTDRPLSRPSVYGPTAISGQARVNAKRNQRAAFWRTVKIRVHPELEQAFRDHLHHLGVGARIYGRTLLDWAFAIEFTVHIPQAPADAARAEPVWRTVFNGHHNVAELDHIAWFNADGQRIDMAVLA